MTFTRRIALLYRTFKLIPKLDELEKTLPTLEDIAFATPRLEVIEQFLPRLGALDDLIRKVSTVNVQLAKLENFHVETKKVEEKPSLPEQQLHEFNRLKLLSKFVNLAGRAEEIEKEWQRIQQDEHDAYFRLGVATIPGMDEAKIDFAHKSGIAKGIKWCIERFC